MTGTLAALERLRAAGAAPPTAAAAAATAAIVTGTGFYGAERAAIRELAALAGATYSGDLVRGHTTHLVLASAAAAGTSRKVHKAAEWGLAVVRLQWLLDSITAGQLQPVARYLLDYGETPPQPAGGQQQAWRRQQQQEQWQSHAQLPSAAAQPAARHRPSSVASNALPGQQAAAGACCAEGSAAGSRCEREQQQEGYERAALQPVGNLLAEQLRHMSINPEPEQRYPQVHPVHEQQQQARDSPLQRRSPSASPQQSLSLQGLMGGLPVVAACSPMQQSPADSGAQDGGRQGLDPSPPGSAAPFAFSLAAALGRTVSDEAMAHGSPMVESPAAAPSPLASRAARAASASTRSRRSRLASPAASSMAGTPAGGSQDQQLRTMPTPACIRDWSDDDSLGASPAQAAAAPPARGEVVLVRCLMCAGIPPLPSGAAQHLSPC